MKSTIEKKASPSKEEVKAARMACGPDETQAKAASRVYLEWRTWQDYELGQRTMMPAVFELYLTKTKRLRDKIAALKTA